MLILTYNIHMKNIKLIANYHTHTYRCGHAFGQDEEYVIKAIENKFEILGFSDHVFLPSFSQRHIRGDYELLNDYLISLTKLKVKYSDKIKILKGFECEGLPMYFDYYKELLNKQLADYLILGNHLSLDDKLNIKSFFYFCENEEKIDEYVETSIKALETKLFKVFAHPDLFLGYIANFDDHIKDKCYELINCAIKLDIPLEINMGGMRQPYFEYQNKRRVKYPTDFFFNLVEKTKANVIIGVDAHSPYDLDYKNVKFLNHFLDKHKKLNLIEKLDI